MTAGAGVPCARGGYSIGSRTRREGAVLITSSTAEEASVERDDLGGSCFRISL